MSSNIPNSTPIPLTVYTSLDAFGPWLNVVLNHLIELWADAGTPALVGGPGAYSLILRKDTLPTRCAQVRVQRDAFFNWQCHVEIEFVGDASALALYIAFLDAFKNELPDEGSPFYKSAYEEREMLKSIAAHYTRLLLSPEAKLIQAINTSPKAKPKKRRRANLNTQGALEKLRELRMDCFKNNKQLPTWTKACQTAGINPSTANDYAADLHRDWEDKEKDYRPNWYDSELW